MEPGRLPFSEEVPELLSQHFDQLHCESGISIDVTKERGYRSVLDRKEILQLGYSRAQARVPGILIPLHGTDGKPAGWQYRPDNPRIGRQDRPIKYENPKGSGIRLG